MYYIVGLGNPGKKYTFTRHNIGFRILDSLAARLNVTFVKHPKSHSQIAKIGNVLLIKPQTYMNDSGVSVSNLLKFYEKTPKSDEFRNLIVVHDDLDLVIGSHKLIFNHGPKVHNGLSSIRQSIGTSAFWYLKIGVDGRNGQRTQSGSDYVLEPFSLSERSQIETIITTATNLLYETFCT